VSVHLWHFMYHPCWLESSTPHLVMLHLAPCRTPYKQQTPTPLRTNNAQIYDKSAHMINIYGPHHYPSPQRPTQPQLHFDSFPLTARYFTATCTVHIHIVHSHVESQMVGMSSDRHMQQLAGLLHVSYTINGFCSLCCVVLWCQSAWSNGA
jgi:hypothetical protein